MATMATTATLDVVDALPAATGGYDGNIRYYDVTNGSPLQDFPSVTIR